MATPSNDKALADDTGAEKDPSLHIATSQVVVDDKAETALLRKLDLHMIPIIMLLYLFSFLDRVNIGNARLYGLEEDLGLTGNQYQVCASILFVTYCFPSNLIIKKFKPDRYIAFIVTGWGIITTLTTLVQGYGGLIAVRLILGVLEAGLFPGLLTYLTMFYSQNQLAIRVGYLFIASTIAGALGGIIAYGIGFTDGTAGMRAWRWLMIIEGIPSVIIGVAVFFTFSTNPASVIFLTPAEKELMFVIQRVLDWQVWLFSFSGFTNDIMFYGFSTFLPTIIKGLDTWTSPQANALTVPVYAVGTGTYLVIARLSDRQAQRGIYSACFGVISIIGYCMLIANYNAALSYTGCYIIAIGLYVSVELPLAWLPGNKPRYGQRAFATGLQLTIGNTAGITMPFLYSTASAPKYYTGYGVSIAAVTVSVGIFSFMTFYYMRVNTRRAQGKEDWKLDGKSEAEIEEMGDKPPRYVYNI